MTRRNVKITVPALARVEGEGALDLEIREGEIHKLHLRIYEPPRFFEKFLEGRSYHDVPDTVARICGICPVAYQMSAVQALEAIMQLVPSQWVLDMRRLMYCGEWIQSHSLHIHLLALPDFLGFNDVTQMAEKYPDVVRRGLGLQAIGNDLIALFGGRSVHPVGVRAGGFSRAPLETEMDTLLGRIEKSIPQAEAMLLWLASLELPDDEQDFISVALRHEIEYPMYSGRLVSSQGLDIAITQFDEYFEEYHEPHSTALYCRLQGKPYLVGPLARLNLNLDRLPAEVNAVLEKTGIRFPSKNMFHSVIARALEIVLALYEARRLLEDYESSDTPYWSEDVRAGTACGCTEAPRGILWHQYRLDEHGLVQSARIVPPTSQNQARIEEDLHEAILHFGIEREEEKLRLHAEKVIRNYDPCISCATHFLQLNLKQDDAMEAGCCPEAHGPVFQRVLVAGIGSALGNDRLGWDVIDALQAGASMPANIMRLLKLDRPGADLSRHLSDADCFILVDAIADSNPDQSIRAWRWDGDTNSSSLLSSHGFAVPDALRLQGILEQVTQPIYLVGLSLEPLRDKRTYTAEQLNAVMETVLGIVNG